MVLNPCHLLEMLTMHFVASLSCNHFWIQHVTNIPMTGTNVFFFIFFTDDLP